MSKKIAAGANKIVLDVTCGSGAFMKTVGEARELSKTMIDIGKLANKETVCIITNMDQPLGTMVGNILEVIEAIEALKGNMQDDVKNVVLELGAYILKLDGKGDNIQENKEKIEQVISNGDAYKKFLQLVENQGGDISYIENTEKFTKAKYKMPVEAVKTGYVQKLNAEEVGKIAMHLGAGRMKKEDNIDYAVGIELLKKVGCQVEQGETIAYIYADDEQKGREAVEKLQQTYEIGEQNVEKVADIIEIIE
jgi:pyrimidine-nucleoside phosphorylase